MFNLQLQGKIAVVTGGCAGIGYAISTALARNGAAVIIVDIAENGEDKAKQLRDEGFQAQFIHTDIQHEAEIKYMVSEAARLYGGVDILINNAGIYPFVGLQDTTEMIWDDVMNINLKGMFLCCQSIVPQMIEKGGGAIVNLGSNHADVGMVNLFAYSVSKGGVKTLTRNLAGALSKHKIRVNCVNPGWVITEREIAERKALGQGIEWLDEQGKNLPLGRMQTGEDTAAAVLFLVSPQGSQVTGQILNVDGGVDATSFFDRK
jgi:NAD(P)-dependent dehydrogenase (short-subunit alcohol dehydrogenase family)